MQIGSLREFFLFRYKLILWKRYSSTEKIMHFELSRREAQNLCYPPAMSNSHQKPIQFLVSPYGTISIFFTFCLTMKRRERRKRFYLFAEESEKQNVNFSWVLFLPLLVRSKNAKASIKFYLKGTRAPQFLPSNCFSNRFVFLLKQNLIGVDRWMAHFCCGAKVE